SPSQTCKGLSLWVRPLRPPSSSARLRRIGSTSLLIAVLVDSHLAPPLFGIGHIRKETLGEYFPERCREHEQPGVQHQLGVIIIIVIDALPACADEVMLFPVWLLRNFLTVRDDVPQVIEVAKHFADGRLGPVIHQ